jgi:RNA binding exosome subunit
VGNKYIVINKLRAIETLTQYSNQIQIIEARLQHWRYAKYTKEVLRELTEYRQHRQYRKVKKQEEDHTCAQFLLNVRGPRILKGCFTAAK